MVLALHILLLLDEAFATPPNLARSTRLICYEDNQLRALEAYPQQATESCPGLLAGDPESSWLSQWGTPAQLSSACVCFEKTAVPSKSALSTGMSVSPTSNVLAPSSSTIAASSTMTSSSYATSTSIELTSILSLVPSSSIVSTNLATPSPAGPIKFGSTGKRGIVYDYTTSPNWSTYFLNSPYAVWGSDWNDNRISTSLFDQSFTFVPTIRVDKSTLTNGDWNTTIPTFIAAMNNAGSSTTLFGTNEPDNAGQANLTPAQAVIVHQRYMQPFYDPAHVALGTPAITNGGGTTGLNYLDTFVSICEACNFNFINIHFYLQRSDVNTTQFAQILRQYIDVDVPALQAKHANLKGLPVVLGEFWLMGASDDEGVVMLKEVLPYLDGNARVLAYQAFGGLWKGNWILQDGSGLTPAGQVYASFE